MFIKTEFYVQVRHQDNTVKPISIHQELSDAREVADEAICYCREGEVLEIVERRTHVMEHTVKTFVF